MTQPPAVEARGAMKVYGAGPAAITALDCVSVEIAKGEFFTLLGPSGCGKTTLLRLIAGFETPSDGAILLDGVDVSAEPPNKRPVNTVFQSYALFPHLSVAENIAFGLEMLNRPKAEVKATVAEMLELVRMTPMAGRRVAQLSGGQQQRVALARALAPRPKVLLLDEPLSALDLKLRKEMQSELKRLQRETGITFVFVTHDQEEALTMSDRIAVMEGGRVHQVGAPRDIYNHPVNRFVADFIGETNFIGGHVAGGALRLADGAEIALPGRSVGTLGEGEAAVLAIRPEQLRVGPAGGEGLAATVVETVYFGTDTHLHLKLEDGEVVVARLQSPPSGDVGLAAGAGVTVRFEPEAAQLLGG
ncbi:MAG: ABC transporter ATP-binding protein [Paracoccaceae bacterium]